MSSLVDTARLDRVAERAQQIHLGRSVLALLAGLLYALGVAAAWVVRAVLTVLGGCLYGIGAATAWSVAAVRIGWEDTQRRR